MRIRGRSCRTRRCRRTINLPRCARRSLAAERHDVSQTGEAMDDEESENEFIEDFGASRLDDASVQALLVRTRAGGDLDLRRLVKDTEMAPSCPTTSGASGTGGQSSRRI